MTQRLLFLATLCVLALAAPLALAAGDGTKKLKVALDKLNQVTADSELAVDDARLVEADAAMQAVAQQNDADGAKALLGLLMTPFPHPSVEVFVSERARDALTSLQPGAGRDEVRAQLEKKKRDPRVAVPLAEVIGGWSEEASVTALADLLTQRDDRLVMAAARGLERLARKECVRPLITAFGALKDSGGEPFEAVGGALLAITGQGFRTQEDWTKFWDTNEATWTPASRNAAGSAGASRVRSFQPDPPKMFESMEIRSKKVVIILDISGSMHIRNYVVDPIEPPPPPTRRGRDEGDGSRTRDTESETGDQGGGDADAPANPANPAGPPPPPLPRGVDPTADGYKKKPCVFSQCPGAKGTGPECPSDENLPPWYRRHDRLMRQVSAVVTAFRGDVKFNLVSFSTDARTWKGSTLVEASEANKRLALRWIQGLQPAGFTLADKALDLAFKFEEADTIIFVTDGAPTNANGRPYDATRWRKLNDEVKRLNKNRHVKIDVIAIAEGHTDFARNLAAESGGTYSSVP